MGVVARRIGADGDRAGDLRRALALSLTLLAAYSLVYSGDNLGCGDEIVRYLMTDNLAQGRGFRAEYLDLDGRRNVYWGQAVPKYGFLHPLLAAPFRLLSRAPSDPREFGEGDLTMLYEVPAHRRALVFTLWFSPVVATLLCLVFYQCGRRLGFAGRECLLPTFLLGLCTIVFAYTPLFFTETLTGLLLTAAFCATLERRPRDAVLCGVLSGLLPCNNAMFLFAPAVLLLAGAMGAGRRGRLLFALRFAFGLLPGFAFLAFQFVSRGGFGYSTELSFITPLAVGLFGNLLSPGKSVFVFSPVALLGIAGFVSLFRSHRRPAVLAALLVVIPLLAYSKWSNWAGCTCWGPRFLLPVIPLVMLGAFPVLAGLRKRGAVARSLTVGLVLVSLAVQLSATLVAPYAWFHHASERLGIRMSENRYAVRGVENSLLLFQNAVPYFPEYCPPYLQMKALGALVGAGRFDGMTPAWIRRGRFGWGAVGLLVFGGGLLLLARVDRRQAGREDGAPGAETSPWEADPASPGIRDSDGRQRSCSAEAPRANPRANDGPSREKDDAADRR
ncbi:MAG TPA: hypothetical protein VM492_02075 [Sumerlaeia bacterium]|nr:hypothetical protein [Sumerlaeia bacterium]